MTQHSTPARKERREYIPPERHLHIQQRLCDETTPNMLVFTHESHSIRIVEEKYGCLVCTVTERTSGTLLHTVRFVKKPHQGVVYQFRDQGSLSYLAFAPEKLTELSAWLGR